MGYKDITSDRAVLSKVHASMKSRCTNVNNLRYDNYGGRGISVCDKWIKFDTFYNWAILNGYKKGLQIDRINNDGNYEPLNCKWVTNAENNAIGKRCMTGQNKSGYTGIGFRKDTKKWRAYVKVDYRDITLGSYITKVEALLARIDWEISAFGVQKTNLGVING